MAEIALSQGMVALVDDEDTERLQGYAWYAAKQGRKKRYPYAVAGVPDKPGRQKSVRMHRLIMNAPDGSFVDHVNGNTLDNRKANLRLCNNAQNCKNRKRTWGTSKYLGVGWKRARSRWVARIYVDGRHINLGGFEDERAAAKAYDKAAIEYHGEFASMNFPEGGVPSHNT